MMVTGRIAAGKSIAGRFNNDLSIYPQTLFGAKRSTSHSGNEDDAFLWARKHPTDAKAGLEVPPIDFSRIKTRKQPYSFGTLQEYLTFRNWNLLTNNSDKREQEWAQRLVSHVLSSPLTLAFASQQLDTTITKYCCVGARAEATLPLEYWKEFLLYNHALSAKLARPDFSLDFVGPHVPSRPSSVHNISLHNSKDNNDSVSRIQLKWHRPCYLHDLDHAMVSLYDAFVLYNPGFGHDNLKEGWRPTLDLLVQTKKPMIVTAHSPTDAERDAKILEEYFPSQLEYKVNPFASQISYLDPFGHKDHMVRPNQFAAVIQP